MDNLLTILVILANKYNADGSFNKTKARFVIDGSRQGEESYHLTFAPVATLVGERLVLTMACEQEASLWVFDIVRAFCKCPIEEGLDIYVRLPRELGGGVARLNKCVYGLKQAARQFYLQLDDVLVQRLGYKRSKLDPGLYYLQGESDTKPLCLVTVHVDDIAATSKDETVLQALHNALIDRFKEVTLDKTPTQFLGVEIQQHEENSIKSIKLSQAGYASEVAKRYGVVVNDGDRTITPHEKDLFKVDLESPRVELTEYRAMLGCLMYLQITYPEIAVDLVFFQSRLKDPREQDVEKMKRCIRYLVQKRDVGIWIRSSPDYQLTGTVDASHNILDDGTSITGYTFTLGGGSTPLLSGAIKQKNVALSSCEAEYVAWSNVAQKAVFLYQLLEEVGFSQNGPVRIENDNQAAILLAKRPEVGKGLRHVLLRYHFFKCAIKDKFIDPSYRKSEELLADILTKPLTGRPFWDRWRLLRGLDDHTEQARDTETALPGDKVEDRVQEEEPEVI